MFYLDGIKSLVVGANKRWYLYGDNAALVEIFISLAQHIHNGRKVMRVSSDSDYRSVGLFEDKRLVILTEAAKYVEADPDDIVIKKAKYKVPKKWSDNGYKEVVCNRMFMSQVYEFVNICEKLLGISFPKKEVSELWKNYPEDFILLWNVMNVRRYGNVEIQSISSESECVGHFVKGHYKLVMDSIPFMKLPLFLYNLISRFIYLYKFQNGSIKINGKWLSDQLYREAEKFRGKFDAIIIMLNDMLTKVKTSRDFNIRLDFLKLICFIEGSTTYL